MDTTQSSNTPSTMSFIINDIVNHSEQITRASGMIGALWEYNDMRNILSEMGIRLNMNIFSLINDILPIISQGHNTDINDIDLIKQKSSDIIMNIKVMSGYFTTLQTIGFVSKMNRDVLVRELNNLTEQINNLTNVVYNNYQGHISNEINDIGKSIKDRAQKNIEKQTEKSMLYHTEIDAVFGEINNTFINDTSIQSIKDIGAQHTVSINDITNSKNSIIKNTGNLNDIVKDIPMSFTKPDRLTEMQLEVNRRKQSIIETLKTKHSIQAHELGTLFPQYSRKTLQRDMADLAGAGIIKKTGEKRWSEYILVAN